MTQDEFDELLQEIREEDPEQLESEFFVRDKPLKEDKLAKLEQKAGFSCRKNIEVFLNGSAPAISVRLRAIARSGKRFLTVEGRGTV